MNIEDVIHEAVTATLQKQRYTVLVRDPRSTQDVTYTITLGFVPFPGLRLNINQGRYLIGTVDTVEWVDDAQHFIVMLR